MKTATKTLIQRVAIITGILLAVLFIFAGITLFLTQASPIKSGRKQFFVRSAGVGGACPWRIAYISNDGRAQCVSTELDKAQALLDDINSGANASSSIIFVDAEVTVTNEEGYVTTNPPRSVPISVVNINKLYSAKILSLPY